MYRAFQPVRQFEKEIAEYAGATYGIAVASCTFALFACCKYLKVSDVYIPSRTYAGVPSCIINAGGKVHFKHIAWEGEYYLEPYNIIDSALRFKKDMHIPHTFRCLSFQYSKHIPIGRGGMILCDDEDAEKWFKRFRFDGRGEVPRHLDNIESVGWNEYMLPRDAADGLVRFCLIKDKNMPDLKIDYDNLSRHKIYERS